MWVTDQYIETLGGTPDLENRFVPQIGIAQIGLDCPPKTRLCLPVVLLSVRDAEDLPGTAAHRCGGQISGVKQQACAVASVNRVDRHRAGLREPTVFERVRKLFMMHDRPGSVSNIQ